MDNLEIDKAHIVGLSMGGFATLHLGINAPDRVLSLVIAGCGYGAIPLDKIDFNKNIILKNIFFLRSTSKKHTSQFVGCFSFNGLAVLS